MCIPSPILAKKHSSTIMIDGNQVSFKDKIYGSPNGGTAVHTGTYDPFNADGGQDHFSVVIKVLAMPVDSTAFMEGIMQEVIIQSKLEACDYICKCYGYFIRAQSVCVVMERLKHDLEHDMKLRNGEPYPEAQLTTWMYHVLEALDFARSKNIAHRDIKPQNILLTTDGKVKLVDFGSGTINDGKVQKLTGTPLYMSPEQLPMLQEFQRTGQLPQLTSSPFKSDVYSLGITFLQLALMDPPVKVLIADRSAALNEYFEKIRNPYPILSWCFSYMLQSDPKDRPDIPVLLQNLKNPANQVVRTLSQSSNVIQTEEQSQQCANCHNMFPTSNLTWCGQYLMCHGCYDLMYRTQAETQVPAAEEQPPQTYEGMGTGSTAQPQEFTAPSMQICKKCSFQSPMTVSHNGTLVWFCGFCCTPHQFSLVS